MIVIFLLVTISLLLFQHISDAAYSSPIYSFPTESKYVALTFNKGPHGSLTPILLDILNDANTKATFFVSGVKVELYPDIVLRAIEEGHEVGSHLYDNSRKRRMEWSEVYNQILQTKEILLNTTGKDSKLMRFPNGKILKTIDHDFLSEAKLHVIMWSIDTNDSRQPSVSEIIDKVLSHVKPGSIILCHDIHTGTIEAIPDLIDQLKAKGYTFKTITELLQLTVPPPPSSTSSSTALEQEDLSLSTISERKED